MSQLVPPALVAACLLVFLPRAEGDEAMEKLILATYKLANDGSTASGIVVEHKTADGKPQRYVVTAQHVFSQMKGDAFLLVGRARGADGAYQRREIQVPIRQGGQPLWKSHASQDLAVLPLPDSAEVDSLPLDSLATEESLAGVHVGDAVRLAVFPERVEANAAGFPIVRGGSIAGYPILPLKTNPAFLVDTMTWTGDSGGPVVHETLRSPGGGPLVLGFVRGMRSIVDTAKESRFVERKTQYPLGLSEVVHAAFARELIADAK